MTDPGIVRNRRKIEAAVRNAEVFLEIQEGSGSFDRCLWGFTGGQIIRNTDGQVRANPELSGRVSADLKRRGMKFDRTVIIDSFLQAVGAVNDHETGCWCYTREAPLPYRCRERWTPPKGEVSRSPPNRISQSF